MSVIDLQPCAPCSELKNPSTAGEHESDYGDNLHVPVLLEPIGRANVAGQWSIQNLPLSPSI